jgi:peptide/nickel transport system permease protein
MRGVDALMAFPRLFLLVALAAYGPGSRMEIVWLLGLTSWMGLARLVRGEVKGLLKTDYVQAARGLGLPPWRLLVYHLLPNALPPILVETAFRVADTILLEATLSFLGFGLQPPAASWGNLVADGWDSPLSGWWVSVFPGAALAATIFAFSRLGDSLQTLFDPRAASRFGPRET